MKFDESPSLAREQAILDAVRAGKATIEWFEIVLSPDLTIEVSNPVMIDGVMIATTSRTAQYIADYFDASLMTERINDILYENATIKLPPFFQTADAHMGDWSRVELHSATIVTVVGGRKELFAPAGKHWLLGRDQFKLKPWAAALSGWQVPTVECILNHKDGYFYYQGIKTYPCTAPHARNIQPMSYAHNCGTSTVLGHVDYSMFVRLWRVKGDKTTKQVLADQVLCRLVSKEGPLQDSRHPGVPEDTSWIVQS